MSTGIQRRVINHVDEIARRAEQIGERANRRTRRGVAAVDSVSHPLHRRELARVAADPHCHVNDRARASTLLKVLADHDPDVLENPDAPGTWLVQCGCGWSTTRSPLLTSPTIGGVLGNAYAWLTHGDHVLKVARDAGTAA